MSKLKVAVFGCGGVLGQHLMISVPPDIEPLFIRKTPSPLAESLDLEDWPAAEAWLNERKPDVIINLAGESRPDVVECDPKSYQFLNSELPIALAEWCDAHGSHLVQVSTQAVFDGQNAPYGSGDLKESSVNEYGKQKARADYVLKWLIPPVTRWTIVRPTFVLGIRPFPAIGRENPAEVMLLGQQHSQVDDRWFSVSFAWDVAEALWSAARDRAPGKTIHLGNPERMSRYELARQLNPAGHFIRAEHKAFQSAAPRPLDTTYADGQFKTTLDVGLQRLRREYEERAMDKPESRARELGAFLGIPWERCSEKLAQGFGPLHNEVTADFRRANPQGDDQLLNWYRTTEAYLGELTAYHCDAGFNYSGMCEGIITRLKHGGRKRVLCLGDGVGTLTIKMKEAGLEPVYHDLKDSRTAAFARFRMACRFSDPPSMWLHPDFSTWLSAGPGGFDAVASMDFLEHVPNVEQWVMGIFNSLREGGLFVAQNAFNCGSGPDGAIPQHLACNDHFEKDWDPLLTSIGFVQLAPQWYQRPE